MFKTLKKLFNLSIKPHSIKAKLEIFIMLFLLFLLVGLGSIFWVKFLNPYLYELLIWFGWIYYAPINPISEQLYFSIWDIGIGLLLIIFVSVKEELVFRFWITQKSIKFYIGLLIFWLSWIIQYWVNGLFLTPIILLFFVLKYNNKVSLYFLILISSLIFGSYHYGNLGYFEFRNFFAFLFLPFICIGQTLGGFLFCIARIKLGMIWGIILHILVNVLFLTIVFNYLI